MLQRPGQGFVSVGRVKHYARNAPGTRRGASLPEDSGYGRIRLAACASSCARRGGFYGVTFNDFADRDKAFEVPPDRLRSQFSTLPILRETWVIPCTGLACRPRRRRTIRTSRSSCCRRSAAGQSAWILQLALPRSAQSPAASRVADFGATAFSTPRCSTTQARWKARAEDLNFDGLKSDYGFGVRFHSPFATALRIDVARSNEGTSLVFAMGSAF